ncbi:MAG TPA: DNA primase [Oceanobacillus sp.]|nr:DNA primase [Oceanobacillus sp.]
MSVIDEIKSKLDIVEYIQRTVPLKKAGRVYKACCPFHVEKTPSFTVDPDRQTWRCFGACAEGGDLFSFAMKQNGWSFQEAMGELAKLAGVELRPQSPEQRAHNEAVERLRGLVKLAADFYHERLLDTGDKQAVETLRYAQRKRGLSEETIMRFQIGYAPPGWHTLQEMLTGMGYSEDDLVNAGVAIRNEQGQVYDRFRNRLMIPIRDERGRVVGFGARALAAEDNPKYLNSPQSPVFDKSRLLFGLDFAARTIRDTETVVIVEGYLDAIQAHQAGYTNVVAQMGTALTDTQLRLVAPRWAKKIVLALDSDAAGQTATRRSLEVAREALQADYAGRLAVDIRILALPGAKDPDDLIREAPEQWQSLVDQAMPVADFVIGMEMETLPQNASVQEREAVAKRLLPLLIASESDLYKKDNLQKLAMKLRIAERDLLAWASEQQKHTAQARRSAPPPDIETLPPDDSFYDLPEFDQPVGSRQGVAASSSSKPKLERYCLRILFSQPELFYHVNRRFRELCGDNEELVQGPLSDLCAEDFTYSAYQALMMVFEEALAQDDMEPLEYLEQQLTPELLAEVEDIFRDDLDDMRPLLRNGLSADLAMVRKQGERSASVIDIQMELIEKSLELRQRRLGRVRQEIIAIFADSQLDPQDASYYSHIAALTNHAKHLIDDALSRQANRMNA